MVDEREQGFEPLGMGKRQEDSAALLAPLEDCGIGKYLEVARDARLALAQDMGKLADRKLHNPQQRHDPKPRRVGEGLESVCERKHWDHLR